MRKITQKIVAAFLARQKARQGNTSTDGTNLYLHGNLIAYHIGDEEGGIRITTAGWPTRTTFERLNAIPGVSVYQKKRQTYLNGALWDGEPVTINS